MMKINKSLIIISLLLILCISLGTVSATDIDVNDVDNNVATVESSIDLDDEINIVNEGEIHNSSEIADEISTATGTYDILYDYKIDTTWFIESSNLIIEGNNHTIYGEGYQAFNINSFNVTIKNLNFVNCSSDSAGGAICWLMDDASVYGCNFINCSAYDGGAIYSFRDGNIINCTFIDCVADGAGGAICLIGEDYAGSIENCSFIDCVADGAGGAIRFYSYEGLMAGCSFINCSAYNDGGAIDLYGYVNISDCSFINCSSDSDGGAIWCKDYTTFTVSDCSFINCSSGSDGGAIYSSYLTVNDCSFSDCSAKYGGAIYSTYLDVVDSSFVNCVVEGMESYGGAIYTKGNSVINSTFDNCSAIEGYVGAIYSNEVMDVEGCNFTNCVGGMFAGAVGSDGGILTVDNCNFVNCSADEGGAIVSFSLYSGGSLTVNDCSFTDCSAEDGGAIYSMVLTSIDNCSFINCTSEYYAGAIYSLYSLLPCTVNDCSFINCSSDVGIILSLDSNIQGCLFVNCSSNEEGIIETSSGSINYNIFDNKEGTAIYIESTYMLGDVDVRYNFFAFQNNLTEFPDNLILEHVWYEANDTEENKSVTPDNWVVLNISSGNGCYFVEFVLNDGSALKSIMPNYDVNLTINGDSKNIVVSNNTFKDTIDVGEFLAKSPNSGNVLVNTTIGPGPVEDYSIKTWDCEYGDTAKVVVVVPDYVTGNISVNVNGQTFTEEIEDGIAIVLINGLSPGTHVLNISYSGDKYSLPFNDTTNLTVSTPLETPMNISNVVSGNNVVVNVTLPVDAKGYVEFYLNDEYYGDSGVRNGVAKFNFNGLDIGNYTIKAIYSGDNKYLSTNVTDNFVIDKIGTSLNASNLNITAYTSKDLVVTLKDSNGKILAGKKLIISLNGKNYTVTTNSSGQAKLTISSIYVKTFPTTITFTGDDEYLASSKFVNVTVVPAYITVNDIIKAAKTLKSYSVNNKKLPSKVKVGSYNLPHSNLCYLMTVAIKNIQAGKSLTTNVKIINVKYTEYNDKVSIKFTKKGYLTIANYLYKKGVNGTFPKYFTYKGKKVGYNVYTYSLAKILAFYDDNKILPTYCVFTNY